jgi:hypothetical protein
LDPLLYSMVPCPSLRGGNQPEPTPEGADEDEENNDKEGTNEGEGTNGKEGTSDDSPAAEVTDDDCPSTPS